MKRLVGMIFCVYSTVWPMMSTVSFAQKNAHKNISFGFNNAPRTFGKTHFIVGHEGPYTSDKKHKKNKFAEHHKQKSHGSLIDKDRICQPFFTTEQDLFEVLSELLPEVKKELYVAAFALTDKRIVDCIIDAHRQGINIGVIVDANNMNQRHSKVRVLVENNVPVWYYKPSLNPKYKKSGLSEPLMHHKYMVSDDFVVTGSANFTNAGQKHNIDNTNVIRDRQTINDYHAHFKKLKTYCVKCTQVIGE